MSKADEFFQEDDYFYSLVQPAGKKAKRSCLRCRIVFLSAGVNNRMCSTCQGWVGKQSPRAGYVVKDKIDKSEIERL
jgi:hypothetical protein